MSTPEPENEDKFLVLHDHSSELCKILPKTLVEPTIVISKILGFDNVDAYAIELIRRELVSLYEGLHEDIDDKVKEYLGRFVGTSDTDIESVVDGKESQ